MLLHVLKRPACLPQSHDYEGQLALGKALTKEVPHLLWHLLHDFKMPKARRWERGQPCFRDPVLLAKAFENDSVSRVHCSLVRTPGGVWVVDLHGQGGTKIKGHSVEYARLAALGGSDRRRRRQSGKDLTRARCRCARVHARGKPGPCRYCRLGRRSGSANGAARGDDTRGDPSEN